MTQLTRREFTKRTAAAAAASVLACPGFIRARGLNEKLQVGFVAAGGKAKSHTKASHDAGLHCVAFAEVDKTRWSGVHEKAGWEQAQGYTDWRKMFENHGEALDVVFVATPDHSHFSPTMTAVSMGIHCYTEKPLTWSVREAQLLAAAYKKNPSVVTQMGNQGNSFDGWRTAYEYIHAGAIGEVQEFHTWTNRPIWPQGGNRPDYTTPVPSTLDWEAWIGPAPMRPYAGPTEGSKKGRGPYHPFNWRGVVDFGSGALGDMACHTTNGIYAIMQPEYAKTVEPIYMTGPVTDQFPAGMIIKSTYRASNTRPGFTTFWYEGNDKDGNPNMPEVPEVMKKEGRALPRTGNLIIGSKGTMLVEGDHWNFPQLLPASKHEDFGKPEQLLERSPGHHEEFFMACRGEKPREYARSNFGYSGPMTANIQLGNLCARVGKKLVLNKAGEITNDKTVNELAWREPRTGWGPLEMNV
ncbi:Glucose--fructose oxidoreductase [Planctomycetales bacterium 10988]|nr:Glucose--fructose oxidoreductase [Planctomycetales bacterium 10988]